MMPLFVIEERLKSYRPEKIYGDHMLNDGMAAPRAERAAAVLILLVKRGESLSVVFTRRTEHLPNHAGQVSFPGGKTAPDDSDAAATALREAAEEIGLQQKDVRVIGMLDQYLTRSGFAVRPVVGVADTVPEWQPDAREVAAIFDVPLDYILEDGRLSARMGEDGRRYYAFDWNEFHVWGATAGMLRNFLDVISEGDF